MAYTVLLLVRLLFVTLCDIIVPILRSVAGWGAPKKMEALETFESLSALRDFTIRYKGNNLHAIAPMINQLEGLLHYANQNGTSLDPAIATETRAIRVYLSTLEPGYFGTMCRNAGDGMKRYLPNEERILRKARHEWQQAKADKGADNTLNERRILLRSATLELLELTERHPELMEEARNCYADYSVACRKCRSKPVPWEDFLPKLERTEE